MLAAGEFAGVKPPYPTGAVRPPPTPPPIPPPTPDLSPKPGAPCPAAPPGLPHEASPEMVKPVIPKVFGQSVKSLALRRSNRF